MHAPTCKQYTHRYTHTGMQGIIILSGVVGGGGSRRLISLRRLSEVITEQTQVDAEEL